MHTARLIAVRQELNAALDKVHEVTFSEASEGLYLNQKQLLPLDAPGLKVPDFISRWALARELLNEPVLSEEKLVAAVCIEQIVDSQIDRVVLQNGKVKWACWGKYHTLNLEDCPPAIYLMAAQALQQGYALKEALGSHFWVTAPSGLVHTTTLRECDCVEFSQQHECVHRQFVHIAQAKRPLFLKHRLIEQVSL
jgi:hypothetical protein